MRTFLAKNWFVLSLPLAVALAWVIPEAGATGGWLRSEVTTKAGVALIFFFQGITLPLAQMRAGAMQWKLHLVVQSFTFLLFPLLGIALDALVGARLTPDLRLGFLYLCVLPSTVSTSVVLTTMARGNTVGAIFNAVLSNLLGVFITPLWVAWLMKSSGRSQALGPVIGEIVMLLLVPLAFGQVVRASSAVRAWVDARRKLLANLSSAIILFIVFAAFANSVKAQIWSQYGFSITLVALGGVLVIYALATGGVELMARLLRLDRADKIAASFCAPQKTLASGVPMAKVIFGSTPGLGLILLPIMFYHPLQLIVCGMLAAYWAHREKA